MFPKPEPKKKASTTPKGAKVTEEVIQEQVENYLNAIGAKFIRIPDEFFDLIYSNESVSLEVKEMIVEYISGLPDLIIPQKTERGTMILPLELKSKTGKPGPKQKKWEKVLGTVYAYSFQEAVVLIDEFFKEEE